MTTRELIGLLETHDPDKRVMWCQDPDAVGDPQPWEVTAVESFEDVLLLTRRPGTQEAA